jgi:hypothetical protein
MLFGGQFDDDLARLPTGRSCEENGVLGWWHAHLEEAQRLAVGNRYTAVVA